MKRATKAAKKPPNNKMKNNKARRKSSGNTRPLPRKVDFGKAASDKWTYSVRGEFVSIRSPKGLVRKFRRSTVSGVVLPEDEKKLTVTPSDVKEFIMDTFGASSVVFQP